LAQRPRVSLQLNCLCQPRFLAAATELSFSTDFRGEVMPSRTSIVALFAFFLLSVTSAVAQTDRGSLTGRVTDPNGAAVANAKITATNVNTAETREVTTSGDGNYTIPELKADPYRVTVEAQGFKTASAENIVVAVQVNRTLDFKLEIGEISTVVTITNDEAPVLQTETPVRQTNVTERQVKELPLLVSSEFAGRTPLSFIYLDRDSDRWREYATYAKRHVLLRSRAGTKCVSGVYAFNQHLLR
jgi:hypothetical protein